MSGDQQATSFGDPNAQPPPPSPRQTPTSSPAFPISVFETPRQDQGSFEEAAGWTPRFAEEYTVFNATPGNLRSSQGQFVDYAAAVTPYTPSSAGLKRPLSAGGIAAEIATHATHFSANPGVPLPPVDPSRRLQSSPESISTPFKLSPVAAREPQSPLQERSVKKARRDAVSTEAIQSQGGQTATPPPTARKGERKLAPKPSLDTTTMQHDQGYMHPDFTATPQQQQQNMADVFATTPTDMFGFPLTAPATAPVYTSNRPFWDDTGMAGMDMDFSVANHDVFQTPTPANRPLGAIDWSRSSNQLFEDPANMPPPPSAPAQENTQPAQKRERPLAPKILMPAAMETSAVDAAAMFAATYPTPIDDPFGIVATGDAVNPGLLFGQPDAAVFDMTTQPPSSSAPAAPESHHQAALLPVPAPSAQQQQILTGMSKAPMRSELRRSASAKDIAAAKSHNARAFESTPIKPSGRPGLSRSFSESRGKRPSGRPALSFIAPAPKMSLPPRSSSAAAAVSGRPTSQIGKPAGRTSPSKGHHHRLSSLTSIPEVSGSPRTRTSVKFTIDANGRARAETTVVVEEPSSTSAAAAADGRRRRTGDRRPPTDSQRSRWDSSDEDASSTDDEPIIIPSRNTSFALPDPLKPTRPHPFHGSQHSLSEQSSSTYPFGGGGGGTPDDDGESEAETVMNEAAATAVPGKAGDAASELRRLVETRQKRPTPSKAGSASGRRLSVPRAGGGLDINNNTISPTTLTDSSLPTPSTDSRGQGVRCVCRRPELDGDDFVVQCGSCEYLLHGRCINLNSRPNIYICAFCAETPNQRSNRGRDGGRKSGALGLSAAGSSPLAHKSFRSFR